MPTKKSIKAVSQEAQTLKEAPKKTKKAASTVAKPVKKETAKKPKSKKVVQKKNVDSDLKTVKDYVDAINWKKGEAKALDWLYIELSAAALLTQFEAGKDNLKTVCDAMYECMLEGDYYINEPTKDNCATGVVAVRYYCDNLSPERKKYSEVNQ